MFSNVNIDNYTCSNDNSSFKRQRRGIPAVDSRKYSFSLIENAVGSFLERYKGLLKDCMVKSGLEKNMTIENNPIFIALMPRASELDNEHVEWAQSLKT